MISKMNKKGVGLLAIWGSVFLALITIFLMYHFLTPIIGQIEYQFQSLLYSNNLPINEEWRILYFNVSSFLQLAFSFFFIALFISLIIFVIVQSARRETYEYEEDRF